MANKFVIHYSTEGEQKFWWQLETKDRMYSTGKEFDSEEECRQDIIKLKKACTRYTKVEKYAGE